VEAGHPLVLAVDGRPLALAPEEVLVEATSPEGYAVAEERGILIALDTMLTAELRDEGLARDLVRHIQDARKNAGFAIADRIEVYLDSEDDRSDLTRVVARWSDYVRGETLADRLVLATPPAQAHVERLEDEGYRITLGVLRR
jgi:isoleucyl-tRNA synthetase